MTSFYLNHLFKDPINKYSHILKYRKVRASTYEFGRTKGHEVIPCLQTETCQNFLGEG